MTWVLQSPEYFLLAAVFLLGAGLGFGGVTGKGWCLVQKLKNGGNGLPPRGSLNDYQKIQAMFRDAVPCKEHSGLVADVKHLIRATEEIKGGLDQLWGAVNELRRELRMTR